MQITRKWSTPNANTFEIKPIKELILEVVEQLQVGDMIIDPFANNASILNEFDGVGLDYYSNDLDPKMPTDYHLDALEFIKLFQPNSVGLVLYDPPYSPRQVSEHYKRLNHSVDMQTTQASYWAKQKKAIAKVVRSNGYVITCGWNSGGIGKTLGFEIVDILLVPHGGWHNDTIVTVERKER